MKTKQKAKPHLHKQPNHTTTCENPRRLIPKIVGGYLFVVDSQGQQVAIDNLSKKRLVNFITGLSKLRQRKFLRRKDKKYGNLNKGFTEEELIKFFSVCKHSKARLAFMLQAFLGLRVSEVVQIRTDDVDFMRNRLRVSTLKANTGDFLYLHENIRKVLFEWIQKNRRQITSHKGYVLFSSNRNEDRNYISANWLRNEFNRIRKLAGLDDWYAFGDDEQNKRIKKPRKLYRLSTHSLRHYFITRVYRASKNMQHTQKLARHTDMKSTQTYIYTSTEELESTMKEVFEKPLILS